MTPAFAAAADREMHACRDACRELQRMMDMLNADRLGSLRGANFFPMVTGRKASQAADPSPFYRSDVACKGCAPYWTQFVC
jgi:hypothetical protein